MCLTKRTSLLIAAGLAWAVGATTQVSGQVFEGARLITSDGGAPIEDER